jgi:hypothetical protein
MPAAALYLSPGRAIGQARQLGGDLAPILGEGLEGGTAARLETSSETAVLRRCLSSKPGALLGLAGV